MQKVLIESLLSILELTGLTEQKGKQQPGFLFYLDISYLRV